MQPSKDAAGSQTLPSSSQSTAYLPPPDLISPFTQSLGQRRVKSDSDLSVLTPNEITPMRRSNSDEITTMRRSRSGQPPKSLVHHLAHIRYLPPEKSIASMTGIRQHIAHYLHLYRTGLCETPFIIRKLASLSDPSSLQNLPSLQLYFSTLLRFAARLCWNPFARIKILLVNGLVI
jgi:hypothetical protein